MAWTPPRTFVTGEVLTASALNTHVRDNLLIAVQPYVRENTWTSIGTIAGASNTGTVAPTGGVANLTAPITGRLYWTLTGFARNTVAGNLSSVTAEILLAGSVGQVVAQACAPVVSMPIIGTGWHDVTAGTSYAITARVSTSTGTGTYAFEGFSALFRYATLM